MKIAQKMGVTSFVWGNGKLVHKYTNASGGNFYVPDEVPREVLVAIAAQLRRKVAHVVRKVRPKYKVKKESKADFWRRIRKMERR